jgi:hypothetical protein
MNKTDRNAISISVTSNQQMFHILLPSLFSLGCGFDDKVSTFLSKQPLSGSLSNFQGIYISPSGTLSFLFQNDSLYLTASPSEVLTTEEWLTSTSNERKEELASYWSDMCVRKMLVRRMQVKIKEAVNLDLNKLSSEHLLLIEKALNNM